MAVSKVVYGGKVLVDLTSDTVTADSLMKGHTAHGKDGELITGKLFSDVPKQFEMLDSLEDSSGRSILDSSNTPIDGRLVYTLG